MLRTNPNSLLTGVLLISSLAACYCKGKATVQRVQLQTCIV